MGKLLVDLDPEGDIDSADGLHEHAVRAALMAAIGHALPQARHLERIFANEGGAQIVQDDALHALSDPPYAADSPVPTRPVSVSMRTSRTVRCGMEWMASAMGVGTV